MAAAPFDDDEGAAAVDFDERLPRWAEVPIPSTLIADCDALVIDFETAAGAYASACAIGMVWLRGFVPVARAFRLIRPPDNVYSSFNIGIHGIRPADTLAAPSFAALWPELEPHFAGTLAVAHNASFDAGVLTRTLGFYGIDHLPPAFLCTVRLARRVWPDLLNHKLPTVAAEIGYAFRHHHALEDAEAAAAILCDAARITGAAHVDDLLALATAPVRFRQAAGLCQARVETGSRNGCRPRHARARRRCDPDLRRYRRRTTASRAGMSSASAML